MTFEEAKIVIEKMYNCKTCDTIECQSKECRDCTYECGDFEMIAALKKTINIFDIYIAKKPITGRMNFFCCPNPKCEEEIEWDESDDWSTQRKFKHCPICGQAIDWGK